MAEIERVEILQVVKAQGFGGTKIKIGRPHVSEDIARLAAVRETVGPGFEIMVDTNQAFTVGKAIRRARQADVARIGGITPWLKVAHLAETFNVPICPHFLMELHVSLCAAVPNAA